MSEVKRWSAMYYPLGNLAGPEAATMVFASAYDAKAAECERLRATVARLDAEVEKLRGLLSGVHLIAINDRGGCRHCVAIANAIVQEARAALEAKS